MDLKRDVAIKQKEESNIKLHLMIGSKASMKIMNPNRNSEPYQCVCVCVCVY